jgi:hypothetical protein
MATLVKCCGDVTPPTITKNDEKGIHQRTDKTVVPHAAGSDTPATRFD